MDPFARDPAKENLARHPARHEDEGFGDCPVWRGVADECESAEFVHRRRDEKGEKGGDEGTVFLGYESGGDGECLLKRKNARRIGLVNPSNAMKYVESQLTRKI